MNIKKISKAIAGALGAAIVAFFGVIRNHGRRVGAGRSFNAVIGFVIVYVFPANSTGDM